MFCLLPSHCRAVDSMAFISRARLPTQCLRWAGRQAGRQAGKNNCEYLRLSVESGEAIRSMTLRISHLQDSVESQDRGLLQREGLLVFLSHALRLITGIAHHVAIQIL